MVDFRSAVIFRARAALALGLAPLRRGSRTVHLAPESGIGFGNYLYLMFDAHRRQVSGSDYRVLISPAMRNWLSLIPAAQSALCIPMDQVRFADRRESWRFRLADNFGEDFYEEQLHNFVSTFLRPLAEPGPPDEVVVNIRRGDYYSNPYVRGTHGFDVAAYLEGALELAHQREEIRSIVVVSDDVSWCHARLHYQLKLHTPSVSYSPSTESPQENFRRVSGARRLIGTNSTFSYWGGYMSNVIRGADSDIVMPWFHARRPEGYAARQLAPHWTVVTDIPGGWDS